MSAYLKSQLVKHADDIDAEDLAKLNEWICEGVDETHFPGMSYEEGMRDMLEYLIGEHKASDLMG